MSFAIYFKSAVHGPTTGVCAYLPVGQFVRLPGQKHW
jgi:hypothetical protein